MAPYVDQRPGEHEPVISPTLWQQVQEKLQANMNGHKSGHGTKSPCLLTGLIYDSTGNRFSPTRAKRNGKYYRYYISQALLQYRSDQKPQIGRIPADEIEWLIRQEISRLLNDQRCLVKMVGINESNIRLFENVSHKAKLLRDKIEKSNLAENRELLRSLVTRVTVVADEVTIDLNRDVVTALIGTTPTSNQSPLQLNIKTRLLRCGLERRLVPPNDPEDVSAAKKAASLKLAVINGFRWREQFFNGTYATLEDIARANNIHATHVGKMIELSFLPPKQVEQILTDTLSAADSFESMLS